MIALDIDGTLLHYDGWKGPGVFGEPLPGAVEFVQALASRQAHFCYFTSRDDKPEALAYLTSKGFPTAEIIGDKDKRIHVLFDDRAYRFDGKFPDPKELTHFKPWWKA